MIQITTNKNQSLAIFDCISSSHKSLEENLFICGILEKAAEVKINIDMIAGITGLPSIPDKVGLGFTFDGCDTSKFLMIVKNQEIKVRPLINCGNAKIVIKSPEMVDGVGFAAKVFAILQNLECSPLLITTGIDEISLLVHESFSNSLENQLKKIFENSDSE
ncbi:MAG: hypothetical protein FWF76_07615 [Oscillospiraceae bacterium]|nr:hypothetical protein [Oscillospiraceae bacterium]